MSLREYERKKLKGIIEKIIERGQGYWASDQKHWYGAHKPIPDIYKPGAVIQRLSREDRWILEQAKPEDFEGLRLDWVNALVMPPSSER